MHTETKGYGKAKESGDEIYWTHSNVKFVRPWKE
jgi:hypothetical protein